ncbi:site-specific integrase [Acinetobacter pittii]|uniref:site-specific integrase n=1 Tax=Acinetobacter pittii TaxID=48296 RepID=UPI0007103305|nr:tyrosine-type recombinase/integrase [Acinetobacter pittii]KAI0681471.1 site-specific integrase [Acinetobacter pittii]KQF49394.1 integrase [Acinetobacter pittii]MBA0120450.1 tyrosine-type recombinase/integrase [Acinetobacter pittii]MBA0130599.1 tyrosine-type recombinase/integrase [Acinetobacter pittii]MBA0134122.1 tyrosine-type recombinase/integrase [Acinetobacter pittii]
MGTVTKRQLSNGTVRYRAQVRVQREGYPPYKASKTFSKKSLADEWIKRTEAEIEINPDKMLNPTAELKHKTLADFITQYLEEADRFAKSKTGALKFIASLEISEKNIYSLKRQDFSDHAIARRKGDPLTGRDGVSPATALKDLSHIKAVLVHAQFVWGEPLEEVIAEFEKALIGLTKARIVTRGKLRDRLPTDEELQALTTFFYKTWKRKKKSVPMHLIMWFAIYSGRREDEICTLRLPDYDRANSQWLVRDAKHPDGSEGNHKYAHFEPKAIELANKFLEHDTRKRVLELGYSDQLLIPVNSRTVSVYFTRACNALEIEDLRFHDLRHEAATRYAEDGFSIPKLQTITLHESWNTLKRYVNLKKRGRRLDFAEAMSVAEAEYNNHYKEWNKKQRVISEIDTFEAFDVSENIEIDVPYSFIKTQLEQFIEAHKQSKYFIRKHVKKLNTPFPFAWNKEKQEFYITEIQIAWEDWFVEHGHVDWSELPPEASHFSFKKNKVIRLFKNRVLEFEHELKAWLDISDNYYFDEQYHIEKE